MAIRVDVDDTKLNNFSRGAQDTLKIQLEKYADEIIKEANLIEEGLHENEANTEITSSFVIQAVRKSRAARPKRRSKYFLPIKIAAFVSVLITGALFDLEAIQGSTGRLIAFIVAFIVASVTTILQFIGEEEA